MNKIKGSFFAEPLLLTKFGKIIMFDPYMYPNCIDLDVKCEHEFLTIRENYSRTDWVPEAYHGQRGKVIKSVFPKAFITGSASFLLEFENEERMWISSLSVQEYMFPWEKKENIKLQEQNE